MLVMLTELLSGLALFLFGMKFMSEGLQKAAGDKMRVILDRVTKNRFVAVFFGAIFTAIIQSSGATTVMEVSFVNAGLLTLEQSVGITFGANIGTTITAQLVSLKLTAIAPYIIFVGACLMMFGNKPITRKISEVIFGFGALFLGINSMTGALSRIPEYPVIMHWFSYLKNPFITCWVTVYSSSTEFLCNGQCISFISRFPSCRTWKLSVFYSWCKYRFLYTSSYGSNECQ